MKNESERRKYDLIYPSLKEKTNSSQHKQKQQFNSVPTPQSDTSSEAAQIAALQKSKQERAARWRTSSLTFESSIFEIRRVIRRVEQEIKGLDSIVAAEAAAEVQKDSWGAWLRSPIYKKAQETDEEKAHKDRARQERRIEKDMKERRLDVHKARLREIETSMRTSKAEIDAADSQDEAKIQAIRNTIWLKEHRERREREKAERERQAQQMRQQQEQRDKHEREAAEARRQQEEQRKKMEQRAAEARRQQEAQRKTTERKAAEARRQQQAAEDKRREEEIRRWQNVLEEEIKKQHERSAFSTSAGRSGPQTRTATCRHDGWWPKVQGRTACPECYEIWTYLFQCPGCDMKACPKCQAAVRPRRPRNTARTERRAPPRVRTPSPEYHYDDFY